MLILRSYILTIVITAIFLILNLLDAHSTWLVVKPNNYHRERNILARFFFKKLGIVNGIIIFKILLLAFMAWMIYLFVIPDWETINIALGIGNLIFTAVVFNNYRIYFNIKKRKYKI